MDRFRRHVTNPITLGCWFASAAVATITGPFGTYITMMPVTRFLYWAGLIYCSIVVAYLVRRAMAEWLPSLSRTWHELLVPFVFSALFTPMVEVINARIVGLNAHENITVFGIFVFNAIIAAAVTLARRCLGFDFVAGPGVQEEPALSPPSPDVVTRPARPRLYDRIGGSDRRHIQRLTVDDHYVIVGFADGGEHRLLMRFADAVTEMEGQDGFLTHRSHWVSADAVVGAVRHGGRDGVRLVDGTVVPLSRTNRAILEKRGLVVQPLAETVASD